MGGCLSIKLSHWESNDWFSNSGNFRSQKTLSTFKVNMLSCFEPLLSGEMICLKWRVESSNSVIFLFVILKSEVLIYFENLPLVCDPFRIIELKVLFIPLKYYSWRFSSCALEELSKSSFFCGGGLRISISFTWLSSFCSMIWDCSLFWYYSDSSSPLSWSEFGSLA